jgi:hypothetical protein
MRWKHAFWLVVLWSLTAEAVCVNGNPSVTYEFRQSKAVVVATVIAEKQVPSTQDGYFLDGTTYRVRVDRAFKGNASASLDVFTENTSGRFDMLVGSKYLLFIYEEHGRLSIDNCGHSGIASKRAATIQEIARLANPSR